ncbi:MAG: peptidoglycan-binding protein [bacterium]|nr:peptidoglycan-binding protein [bacterium]
MAQHFPDYPYQDIVAGDTDRVADLGTFDEILEGARADGLVSYAPQTSSVADDPRAHYIRHRTIATRLWLLGYLGEKPGDDVTHDGLFSDEFKQAVTRFQEEADLTVDSWVGDQTWFALDALVSFESETGVTKWFREDKPLKALERAVQLRLFTLGLFDRKPGLDFNSLPPDAADRFRRINFMFNLTKTDLPKGLHPQTVTTLFDLDGMVPKVAEAGVVRRWRKSSFRYSRKKEWDKKETGKLASRFIVNLAKIELWLVGFDVDVDGKDDFVVSGSGFPDRNRKLQAALFDFWRQMLKKKKRKSLKLSRSITPEFFKSLHEISEKARRAADSSGDDDYSTEVANELNSNQEIENAWGSVRKKSVSLWDGLKRLWRWIKQGIKKIVSFLKKNVFRAFFRYATKAFKIVKTAVDSVVSTLDYITRGTFPGSSIRQAAIFHDLDFDQTVFVNRNSDPEEVTELGKRLKLQIAMFKLGTRILTFVFNFFKRVATGLIGWARVLSALVRGLKEIKPLYREIKQLKESMIPPALT